MAIVQNPITGRSKKSFGTAVFSKSYDKNVMRTKPLEVKNPRTEAQVKQRTKFSTIIALLKPVKVIINEAYGKSLTTMSPINKVTGLNVKNAFTGDPPVLDHTKVVLCDFEGSTIEGVSLAAQADHAMEITWDPNSNIAEELAAKLTFVLFNVDTNQVVIFRDAADRQDGQAVIQAPAAWVGAQTALHVMTTDYNQTVDGAAMKLIKFKAGVDAASVVL